MAQGIAGFKLQFAERDHQPRCTDYTRDTSLQGGVVKQSVPADTSIIIGERGRKNFDPRFSGYQEQRFKKPVPHKNHCAEEVSRGKRVLGPPTSNQKGGGERGGRGEVGAEGKIHFSEPRSEFIKRDPNFTKKGLVSYKNDQAEIKLELTMNRKQRPDGDTRRNGIGLATGGDKAFKDADREPGFYATGGLIAGSTNTLRKSAKPTLQKREESTIGPPRKLEATYGKLMLRLAQEYDQGQVASLTVSA
jgi:hypothetical protein